ncbi:MAG TPA: FAD-binding oxidoreductase, partial [Chloroflexota bacterium]
MRFDEGSRALYASDSSNYRQMPIGVVVPRDAEDVEQAVAACRRHAAPIVSRGAGTSLAGQACNVAVVLDMSKYMNRILDLDPERRIARVQPGVVLDDLRAAAERHHLTFGPDPATHNRCTLGGMIGNNSCGVHSLMAGKMDENVVEMEVLTYSGLRLQAGSVSNNDLRRIVAEGGERGQIFARLEVLRDRYAGLIRERYPNIPRRVSGYNLDYLLPERGFHLSRALVGSEGTCATVLEATVRLVESPRSRVLLILGFPDVFTACDHVPQILLSGPVGLEGFDDSLIASMRQKRLRLREIESLPPGGGWLLVEFGGQTRGEAESRARILIEQLRQFPDQPNIKLVLDPAEQQGMWDVRESALGGTAVVPGEPITWPGWEDAAVPPERLGEYLRDFRGLAERFGYKAAFYGHFGQGCIHTRIDFDFTSPTGREAFRSFIEQSADLVVGYGGSLSGEHGDGQARGELLERMFGSDLVQAFREFKAIWDPENRMNPGKVVDARPLDSDLRLASFHPPAVSTHFAFTEEEGFESAVLRCVGVGKCRRH